jgi:hypothetical protein
MCSESKLNKPVRWFKISKGARQGNIPSPDLFNAMMTEIIL